MNLTHALGWTLIHFLWQGALIATLLAGALAALRRSGARYVAGCAALILMVICATATFVAVRADAGTPGSAAPAVGAASAGGAASVGAVAAGGAAADYLQALVWAWFAGVLALSVRWLGAWVVAERFARRQTWPAEVIWDEKLAALARRLSIATPVKLAVSALAQVPAVVGWMKPIVLVPAGVFAGLTAQQIEALLAHELAHVRRHDYLVNLAQTAAETLLFYHPAVWWVSRQIRNEREHCCDDLAVETCGNRVAYVQALTELEQMRPATPRLAMAANGGGSLLSRVQRLLRGNAATNASPAGWLAGTAIAVCLLVAGIAASGFAQRPAPSVTPAPSALQEADVPSAAAEPAQAPVQSPAQAGKAAQSKAKEEKQASGGWLDGIQQAGFRDLDVDQLIALKIHNVTGEYIRQMRAAGLQLTADQLVAFRIHDVTAEFIEGLKQAGLSNLKADDLIALRIHGADPAAIRELGAMGYKNLTADQVVSLCIHGVTPAFIRETQKHGFKNLSLEKLVEIRIMGIL